MKSLIVFIVLALFVAGAAIEANLRINDSKPNIDVTELEKTFLKKEELQNAVLRIIQDNPGVVMAVLHNNSEKALDIIQMGSNIKRRNTMLKQWNEDMKKEKHVRTENRPVLGSKEAGVIITAFSDFTCNYCRQSHQLLKDILKDYEGKIKFIFKALPLHSEGYGPIAAKYFYAVAQQNHDAAWQYYNTMFENSPRLFKEGEAYIKEVCGTLQLDMSKLEQDVRGEIVQALLNEDKEDAEQLHIEGTPYFLINNIEVRGALPPDLFRDALDLALNPQAK